MQIKKDNLLNIDSDLVGIETVVKIILMIKANNNIVHLPILVEQDEDNVYIVSCPVFKGCHSYGKTIDEALENIKEVIDMCIEEQKEKVLDINRFVGFREMQISLKNEAV